MSDRRGGEAQWRDGDGTLQRALIGAAGVAAAAGLAWWLGRTFIHESERDLISDAPPSSFRGKAGKDAPVERTVTINRPRQQLYDFWRDFTNLASFMDNVETVEKLDERRWRWVVKAPAGTSVEFVSRITEDRPGRADRLAVGGRRRRRQ